MIRVSSGPGCLVASVAGAEYVLEVVGTDSLAELQDATNKTSRPVVSSRTTIGSVIVCVSTFSSSAYSVGRIKRNPTGRRVRSSITHGSSTVMSPPEAVTCSSSLSSIEMLASIKRTICR
jgi:hypothetical protein